MTSFGLNVPRRAVPLWYLPLPELHEKHQELVRQLRDVEHWHRLVCARLDLAVAAVAGMPESPLTGDPQTPVFAPAELRRLLGIERPEDRLGEAALLDRLRTARADLADHGAVLRELAEEAALNLAVRSAIDADDEIPDVPATTRGRAIEVP